MKKKLNVEDNISNADERADALGALVIVLTMTGFVIVWLFSL